MCVQNASDNVTISSINIVKSTKYSLHSEIFAAKRKRKYSLPSEIFAAKRNESGGSWEIRATILHLDVTIGLKTELERIKIDIAKRGGGHMRVIGF